PPTGDAERYRRLGQPLAIGVDVEQPFALHAELGAARRLHEGLDDVCAVVGAGEGLEQLEAGGAVDDADLEPAIVEGGGRRDADTAAILRRVAEDGEHDIELAVVDSHAMRRESRQHAQDRVEIDQRSAQVPYSLVRE